MGAEHLIFKLTARGAQLDLPTGGRAELSSTDVAAALAMSRLDRHGNRRKLGRLPYLWGLHVFTRDVAGLDQLVAALATRAASHSEIAAIHARGLARVAIIERVNPRPVCLECRGVSPVCPRCGGATLFRIPLRATDS